MPKMSCVHGLTLKMQRIQLHTAARLHRLLPSERRWPVSARNKERYACMQNEYLQDGPLLPTQHPHTHAVEIDDQRMLVELRAELSRKIRLVHPVSLPRWA